jgi:hypothetical protein
VEKYAKYARYACCKRQEEEKKKNSISFVTDNALHMQLLILVVVSPCPTFQKRMAALVIQVVP